MHPVFPAPSVFEGNFLHNSGASCRETLRGYVRDAELFKDQLALGCFEIFFMSAIPKEGRRYR